MELPSQIFGGRENFLVSEVNRDAVAWIDRWPNWPKSGLILCGPPGSGKTHLGGVWMAQSGGKEIMPENILLALDTVVGDEKIKSCFVDDANLADQEALLHLYNCLVSRGGTLAFASTEPPAYWEEGLPDLISRLNSLPIVEIRMPNDELLRGLLIKMFADRQVNVSAELVGFISSRMDRTYQAAQEVVKRLDAESLVRKQAITIPMVKDVFREWL